MKLAFWILWSFTKTEKKIAANTERENISLANWPVDTGWVCNTTIKVMRRYFKKNLVPLYFRHCNSNSNQRAAELPSSQQHYIHPWPQVRAEGGHLRRVYHVRIFVCLLCPSEHHDDHLPADCPGTTQKGLSAEVEGHSSAKLSNNIRGLPEGTASGICRWAAQHVGKRASQNAGVRESALYKWEWSVFPTDVDSGQEINADSKQWATCLEGVGYRIPPVRGDVVSLLHHQCHLCALHQLRWWSDWSTHGNLCLGGLCVIRH